MMIVITQLCGKGDPLEIVLENETLKFSGILRFKWITESLPDDQT